MTENTEKTYKTLMYDNAKIIMMIAELGPTSLAFPGMMIELCENMKAICTKMDKDGLL